MVKLSIIIVSYNVKYYLGQLLLSIERSDSVAEREVWVVDNASTDGTKDFLNRGWANCEWLHTIWNKENVGFGRANNQALRRAKGEYILFLNPDTLLGESTLSESLNFLQNQPDAGAVGVRMLHPNGSFARESKRGVPTPWAAACKLIGLSSLFPRSRRVGRYYAEHVAETEVGEIDIVSGAYMMVRRAVLDQTGGFDEDFFMYGEDIDLSYRIKQAGYHNYYVPTPMLHYKGESATQNTFRHAHVFYNAMLIFFLKHYRNSFPLLVLPIRLFTVLAAAGQGLGDWLRAIVPAKRKRERFLFIGRKAEFNRVADICESYGVDIELREGTFETLPQGHNTPGVAGEEYDYVVYDLEQFPIASILALFVNSKHPSIGTYSSSLHTLIIHRVAMHK